MNLINYNTVFCDWLSVTYSPEEDVIPELTRFLLSSGFCTDSPPTSFLKTYCIQGKQYGSFRIELKPQVVYVSVSGQALGHIRLKGLYNDFLALLSSVPHKVTRLDLAYDRPKDFPAVRRGLKSHHPDGKASFSQKKAPIRELLATRDDGKKSGTYYIGHKRSKISGRIYDKQLEVFEKRKQLIGVCTRYEIVFKGNVSLKDALTCEPLFWKYSGVIKLEHLKPKDVNKWVDGSGFTGWSYTSPEKTNYQRLEDAVRSCGCLYDLEFMADDLGPEGRKVLLKLITAHLTG